MPSPFFSIIVPTYNRAHLIGRTIESVIAQSFENWELLIIDDGSADNSKAVVEKFSDLRINYLWKENEERSVARNKGIELSKGEFICFLDSDDVWRTNHLQLLFETIASLDHKKALYFTGMCWNFPDRKQDVIFDSPNDKNRIEYVITNQIAPSTVCISAAVLQKKKFDVTLRINEDVELFARVAAEYELIQLREETVDFVIHNENTKANTKNYIAPQIHVMEMLFYNPELKNKISPSFKKQCLRNLHHQLINHYLITREFSKMNVEILRFLVLYPFDFQNKSKIVLLLYHLPGGTVLQKIISRLK